MQENSYQAILHKYAKISSSKFSMNIRQPEKKKHCKSFSIMHRLLVQSHTPHLASSPPPLLRSYALLAENASVWVGECELFPCSVSLQRLRKVYWSQTRRMALVNQKYRSTPGLPDRVGITHGLSPGKAQKKSVLWSVASHYTNEWAHYGMRPCVCHSADI